MRCRWDISSRGCARILMERLQADILFAKQAVRPSVAQVLTCFLKDSFQDDLWDRMTLLLERFQNQSLR